ncbi:MAG: Ig-like domain-containing protein [Candidatus Hydrogenedentes bacterium]|nr:Ig-like domain-containing protein [Candidatus Hydrogenedentota bacterium]
MPNKNWWQWLALAFTAPLAWGGVGSVSLIDASGLEFLINTDVTFATSSNASGAANDATYTGAVAATTTGGGAVPAVLGNAFDGYNSLFVNGVSYNLTGASTLECEGRTVEFAEQSIGDLSVRRTVFVPADDSFCRWLNVVTNDGAGSETVTFLIVNNLGSDVDTVIAQSAEPPLVVTTADDWIVTHRAFVAGASSEPRLGHVLQGPNRKSGLSSITFASGNGQPFWEYEVTLGAGETAIVMNFVTGQPGIDAASAKSEELALVPETALACLTATDRANIVNFDVVEPTCALTSATTNPTNAASITVTVTFSEPVEGFEKFDITPTNATVKNFDGSGAVYTFNLKPAGSGAVSASVAAGVAHDEGGNPNQASETLTRTVDSGGPSVAMSTTTPNPSNITRIIDVTVTFSEPVDGFTSSDVSLLNCTLEGFSAASEEYTQFDMRLLPARIVGDVGADIAAGVATDEAGNPNSAAPPFRHGVGPGFSCMGGAPVKGQPIHAGLVDIVPLAAIVLALGSAAVRRKNSK